MVSHWCNNPLSLRETVKTWNELLTYSKKSAAFGILPRHMKCEHLQVRLAATNRWEQCDPPDTYEYVDSGKGKKLLYWMIPACRNFSWIVVLAQSRLLPFDQERLRSNQLQRLTNPSNLGQWSSYKPSGSWVTIGLTSFEEAKRF